MEKPTSLSYKLILLTDSVYREVSEYQHPLDRMKKVFDDKEIPYDRKKAHTQSVLTELYGVCKRNYEKIEKILLFLDEIKASAHPEIQDLIINIHSNLFKIRMTLVTICTIKFLPNIQGDIAEFDRQLTSLKVFGEQIFMSCNEYSHAIDDVANKALFDRKKFEPI